MPHKLHPSALTFVALLVLVTTLGWYGTFMLRWKSAGAIGNDPSTYVQMAFDLATSKTPTHKFPLFEAMRDQGLNWYTFIPPGYRFVAQHDVVVPVFAFGTPLLFTAALLFVGEQGIYWCVPLLSFFSLILTFAVGLRLFANVSFSRRCSVSAMAVVLLATTHKQITLAIVPMSDVPAQFFVTLSLWLALCVTNDKPNAARLFSVLCGLTLGISYLIRHSAILMGIPILLVVLSSWGRTPNRKAELLAYMMLSLCTIIALELTYHARVLEGITAVESLESTSFALVNLIPNIAIMASGLITWRGFGPLILFAPIGIWVSFRLVRRFTATVLAVWFLVFAVFHLPLTLTGVFENELRYILPAYPSLVLSTSVGFIWSIEQVMQKFHNAWLKRDRYFYFIWIIVTLVMFSSGAFAVRVLSNPPKSIEAYGWLSSVARSDIDMLDTILPRNAVIGTSEQLAGAVTLYGNRDAFRLNGFNQQDNEFHRFLALMETQEIPVFIIGNLNCLVAGPDDENLPQWLEQYNLRDAGFAIHELPYECDQHLYEVSVK